MARQNQPGPQSGERSRPIGNYNPGGQAGESVQSGGQRPADASGGPVLGRKSKTNPDRNPGETGTASEDE